MTDHMKNLKLGQIVITRAISRFQKESDEFLYFTLGCLGRHASCDWGELSEDDKQMNDRAMKSGEARVLSVYLFPENALWNATNDYGGSEDRIWIITEWDRSVTTILFPREY